MRKATPFEIRGRVSTIWDHTVSTPEGALSVTTTANSRVVNGSVTVQHNLVRETAVMTFQGVTYDAPRAASPRPGACPRRSPPERSAARPRR